MWYWTVSVGTWGTGSSIIPTQLFYCTDRPTPPVCKPRISKNEVISDRIDERLCNGHDVISDFDLAINEVADPGPAAASWKSFHDGRPKPLRLQGQKKGEPNFVNSFGSALEVEQGSKVEKSPSVGVNDMVKKDEAPKVRRSVSLEPGMLSSTHQDARSEMYGDRYGGADRGLFVGNMYFDDEEGEDEGESLSSVLWYGFLIIGCAVFVCLCCGLFWGYIVGRRMNKYQTKRIEHVFNAL